jgi:hypothetical protein
MALPPTLRAEVKLTTGTGVSVSSRELDALAPTVPGELGVLAVLFWCDDREVAGRWTIADAALLPDRSAETVSFTREGFVSIARSHRHLRALREHVDANWPGFLHAFEDVAMEGHEALSEALARAHDEGTLRERFPPHRVLDYEHRGSLERLIKAQGESNAGRILQDLLAYLVALAGYGSVTNNPVGVPDFVVSGLGDHSAAAKEASAPGGEKPVVIEVTPDELDRLVLHCRAAGDDDLARIVAQQSTAAARAPRR